VKEPQPKEWAFLRREHVLFTYLHLAASKALTENILKSGCSAIAYETTEDHWGQFPLLRPMSEIAGRMSYPVWRQRRWSSLVLESWGPRRSQLRLVWGRE
jgi:alanine dehydrogenase